MFKNNGLKIAVALAIFSFHAHVFSAGFDCNKAKTKVEFLICGNPQLSAMDKKMSDNSYEVVDDISKYKGKDYEGKQIYTGRELVKFKANLKADFASSHKGWLTERNQCVDVACLNKAYKEYAETSQMEIYESMQGL